jgi:hypothetical protein
VGTAGTFAKQSSDNLKMEYVTVIIIFTEFAFKFEFKNVL